MKVMVCSVILFLLSVSMGASGSPLSTDEVRGSYIGGGSAFGAVYVCLPDATGHDIGAACNLRCPGNTCNITVIDDVRGSNIGFRICFDGETFWRPHGYWGTADVPGSKVTVVPLLEHGTHGIVIVR